MPAILDDLRLAVRSLTMSPGFTAIVVLTLGVSVGATTAVFSVVEGVLLSPLPFERPEELVRPTWNRTVLDRFPFSPMGLVRLEEHSRSYSSIGAHLVQTSSVTIVAGGEPEQAWLLPVTAGFWTTLGVTPVLGRLFTPEEDVPGGALPALLSESYWVERFGADPSVIGSTLEMNGFSVEIIGVAPASLRYPFPETDVYVSARIDRTSKVVIHSWHAVARLRKGTTAADAERELAALIPSLPEAAYPAQFVERLFTGTADVRSLRDQVVGPVQRPLLTLLVVSGFVLLIGCVNVANLLLVRGSQRIGQAAVRRALGATRLQMARYVLSESVVLALAGGALGVAIAWLGVNGLLGLRPASIPRLELVTTLAPKVLLYCMGVALATALLFGGLPALRMGSVKATAVVRGGATGKGGRRARRLNSGLVVTEIALAMVVLVASVLLARTAAAVRSVEPGFDSENRLVFGMSPSGASFRESADVVRHHEDVLRALTGIPGVEAAGARVPRPTHHRDRGHTAGESGAGSRVGGG